MVNIFKDLKVVVFISFVVITTAMFNCGGDSTDSSINNNSAELTRIDGRITEVLALKIGATESRLAEIKNTLSFTVTATAQGSLVDGILVTALGADTGGVRLLDQDTTSFDGSFSLFVPEGEVALRFEVDDSVYEEVMQVPGETTVEILVSIDKDNMENPVEISSPGEGGGQEPDEENTEEPEEEVTEIPSEQPVNEGQDTGDEDITDVEEPQGDNDDDDNGGNNDVPTPGTGSVTYSELVTAVNSRRVQGANCGSQGSFGPQAELTVSNALGQAALNHSIDMSENDFFSHTGSEGSSPIDRMRDAGFNGSGWGENISRASYERSAEEVVAGWMTSDGHCSNIMTPGFNVLGSAKASNSSWENWTLNLGTE